jgi:hypothetical protein
VSAAPFGSGYLGFLNSLHYWLDDCANNQIDGEFEKSTGDHVTAASRGHVTAAETDRDHVTRTVIERGHVTAAVVDGHAAQVQADDDSWIPSTYREFLDIFSKKKAETLAPHRSTDHAIDLEPGTKLPYRRIYSLSETELKTLKAVSSPCR